MCVYFFCMYIYIYIYIYYILFSFLPIHPIATSPHHHSALLQTVVAAITYISSHVRATATALSCQYISLLPPTFPHHVHIRWDAFLARSPLRHVFFSQSVLPWRGGFPVRRPITKFLFGGKMPPLSLSFMPPLWNVTRCLILHYVYFIIALAGIQYGWKNRKGSNSLVKIV